MANRSEKVGTCVVCFDPVDVVKVETCMVPEDFGEELPPGRPQSQVWGVEVGEVASVADPVGIT